MNNPNPPLTVTEAMREAGGQALRQTSQAAILQIPRLCAERIYTAMNNARPTEGVKPSEDLIEWALEKSSLHHRLAHENKHLRAEHIASSSAYRELAEKLRERAALSDAADDGVVEALDVSTQLLARYRNETPLNHQPHMIAHFADKAIERNRSLLSGKGEA